MVTDPRVDALPFGQLLRRLRVAAGLTQEALAERAGLSARGLSDLERGIHAAPRQDTLDLLVAVLAVGPADRAALVAAAHRNPAARVRPRVSLSGLEPSRATRYPGALPVPLDPLIGREREVAAVTSLLQDPDVRLVTLTGPGGIGKTRLAVQVGEDIARDVPQGVVFVDFSPLQSPDFVPTTVAMALGVREALGRPLVDLIADFLRERSLLLILDNFEHVVDAAPVVTTLLAAAPNVTALVTSRTTLRLRGDHEYPVLPLPLPDESATSELTAIAANEAVACFTAYARAANPTFRLTPETAKAVVAICRHLDGLPLALELAAARSKVLPPKALFARLEHRLPLLTGGARDAPARQRTLRDAILWSYELLTPDEQAMFRRLGVFAGGWTLAAAEAIVNPEGHRSVLDGLTSLVDKSLVWLDDAAPEPRYRMLETIREFAQDQLATYEDEVVATRQSHATYFASRLQVLWDIAAAVPVDWVLAEQDNLRSTLGWLLDAGETEAALHAAGCLGQYWAFRGGQFAEGRAWLDRALQQGQAATTAARVEALHGLAITALYQGDLPTAKAASRQGLGLAREIGDAASIVTASLMSIEVAREEGDITRAMALAQEALALARTFDDPVRLGWSLLWMGRTLRSSGNLAEAASTQHETLATFRRGGFRWGESDAVAELALIARDQGDLVLALRRFAEALQMRHAIGANVGIASGLVGVADLARRAGYLDEAARLFGAASAHVERYGFTPLPRSRALHGLSLDVARETIGVERFASEFAVGSTLTTNEAVSEAIALAHDLSAGGMDGPYLT